MKRIKPFLSWAGGKSKLVGAIEQLAPLKIRRYYEPFLGGGAVFLSLGDRASESILSDKNTCLINAWQTVRDAPGELEGLLHQHKILHDRAAQYFYSQRTLYNCGRGVGVQGAAQFIYLNKSCFNGLWRSNRSGKINSPIGDGCYIPNNLREVSETLQDVYLASSGFEIIRSAGYGDFVYLDPPYYADRKIASEYGVGNFSEDDRASMIELASKIAFSGAIVVGSDLDTPYTRSLYSAAGFTLNSLNHSYCVGAGNPLISKELLWLSSP